MKLPNYPDPIGRTRTEGEHAVEDAPKDESLIVSTIKAFLWMSVVLGVIVGCILTLMLMAEDASASSDTERVNSAAVKDFIPKDWTMGHWNIRRIPILLGDGNRVSMYTLHQRSEASGYMAFMCMINTASGKPILTHPERWGMDDVLQVSTFALHIASHDNDRHSIHAPHDRYDFMKFLDYFDGSNIAVYPATDDGPERRITYDGDGFSRAVVKFKQGCGID